MRASPPPLADRSPARSDADDLLARHAELAALALHAPVAVAAPAGGAAGALATALAAGPLPLVLADARREPGLARMPELDELGVVALLAVAIAPPPGRPGVLLVADHRAREWSPDDLQLLGRAGGLLDDALARLHELRARRSLGEGMPAVRDPADEVQLDVAFDDSGIGQAVTTLEGRYVRVNPAFCALVGYAREELLGRSFVDLTHPADTAPGLQALDALSTGARSTYQREKRYLHRDGHVVWVLVNVSVARDATGAPAWLVVQMQDITRRRRVEDALRRQAQLFETLHEAVILMDVDARITDWNPAAERIFGYARDEMLGRRPILLHHPSLGTSLEDEIQDALRREERWAGEMAFRRKDGSDGLAEVVVVVQRDATGAPAGLIGVNRDVSERRRVEEALRQSEEQLRQAQKMEAIGRLAGGVAHDFNNLLTAIAGHSQLALVELPTGHAARADLVGVARAADRATQLTRQLLAFSRKQVLQPTVLDPNAAVRDAEGLLRRLLPEHIRVETRLAAAGVVRADPVQLEQALLNLALNARDAMPEQGTLVVETADARVGPDDAVAQDGVPPGVYVALSVSDTGQGMDAETRAHIFEPFFTTKPRGQGTGLGLATVYGIVRQSGGHVTVASAPGEGSTFTVYLPRASDAKRPAPSPAHAATGALPRGTETVLLVEDEPAVRSSVRRILERHGYAVLEAANGREAIALRAASAVPIHLVVSDVVMPVMGGRELAERLREADPDLRVLFMSGYAEEAVNSHGVVAPGSGFIGKPFEMESLVRRVRAVLDG